MLDLSAWCIQIPPHIHDDNEYFCSVAGVFFLLCHKNGNVDIAVTRLLQSHATYTACHIQSHYYLSTESTTESANKSIKP